MHDTYKDENTVLSDNENKEFSLVSNKWIEQTLKRLIYLLDDENIEKRKKIEDNLLVFFEKKSIKIITTEEKIEKLKEFLKLPFWDKRFELYSV